MEAAGVVRIIIGVGILVLAIAAIIMPLVVILINSKLNRVIRLLQVIAERSDSR